MEKQTESERISIPVNSGSMPAFLCYPEGNEKVPGLIISHDIAGLSAHAEDVACRFAAQGYGVLVPDLFWSTGPPPDTSDREEMMAFRRSLKDEEILRSLDAALNYMREQEGIDRARIGIIGFCMGGYYAFLEAAHNPTLAAVVDFYGAPMSGLLEPARELRVPLMGLFGEEDQSIPVEQVRELQRILRETGLQSEIRIYPDAGHAFFNDASPMYREQAAEDAWPRVLQFLQRHMGG
jgi:carboxymethylenebutenolidase